VFLLADAEVGEDVLEDVIGGDFTEDAAELEGGVAKALGQEFGRDVPVKIGRYLLEVVQGTL